MYQFAEHFCDHTITTSHNSRMKQARRETRAMDVRTDPALKCPVWNLRHSQCKLHTHQAPVCFASMPKTAFESRVASSDTVKMCGFVAYLALHSSDPPEDRWVRSLMDTIAHRGPDDDGLEIRGRVALGFRRLSILDLTNAGHQPMTLDNGAVTLVFNGEIYNYVELRQELQSYGHTFRSSGDAEVLLRAYYQWGTKCLEHLVGMFSFCIADHRYQQLFLARDRFGIKPLYYVRNERGLLFASEIKAIRRSGMWKGEINSARFAQMLAYGRTESVPADCNTYLSGVQQLLAGQSCVVSFDGCTKFEKYWTTEFDPVDSDKDPIPEFLDTFDTSVRQHMRADVPVGVMLSGGMDSVAIACTMQGTRAQTTTNALHAFSYVSPDADESVQLRDTLQLTGAKSHTLGELDAHTFWSTLHQLVWYNDEPVHSPSAMMGFELYRLAAESGVRVVLSGQGADESLGGYQYLFDHMLVTTAMNGELPSLSRQVGHVATATSRTRASTSTRLAKMLRAHALSHFDSFRNQSAVRQFRAAPGPSYLDSDFMRTANPVVDSIAGQRLSDALQRAMTHSPLPHYLRVEDRISMAHGVESRLPFLDHRLVEMASRLPAHWLMSGGWNKRILRESMKGRIPESVRTRRDKLGFPTSAKRWFAGALAPGVREIIADGPAMKNGWFDQAKVQRMFDQHVRGETDASNMIFNVAQVSSWLTWHQCGWDREAHALA